MGEGEQDFKVPLPVGEGFRVRAVRSLARGDILLGAIALSLQDALAYSLPQLCN